MNKTLQSKLYPLISILRKAGKSQPLKTRKWLIIRFPKGKFPAPSSPTIPASWGVKMETGLWKNDQGWYTHLRMFLNEQDEVDWKVERIRNGKDGEWEYQQLTAEDQLVEQQLIKIARWKISIIGYYGVGLFPSFWAKSQDYQIKGEWLYLIVQYKTKYQVEVAKDLSRALSRWKKLNYQPSLVRSV